MTYTSNQVLLRGEVCTEPAFSHENHGRRFYRFYLRVERLSGAVDTLPVMIPEEALPQAHGFVEIFGSVRSFNNKMPTGRRLILSVFVENLRPTDEAAENDVRLIGTVCKEPVYRRTPLGREICDVMLAVSRLYRRTDYIPCILWGKNAQMLSSAAVGTVLSLTGRLQSREYCKLLPDGSETRTAYEVSVSEAEISSS